MNKIVIVVLVLIVVIFVVFVTWGSLSVDKPADAKNINKSDWGKTINNVFGGLQKSVILDCKVKSPAGSGRKCEQLPLEIKVEAAEKPWLPFMKKTTFRTAKLIRIKGEATVTYFDKKGGDDIDNPQRFDLPNPDNDNSTIESLVILEEGGTLTISCKNNTSCQVGQSKMLDELRKPFFIIALVIMLCVVLIESASPWMMNVSNKSFDLPGYGIQYLLFIDSFLFYVSLLIGLALIIPERIQGRVQGCVTLIFSFFGCLGIIVAIIFALVFLILLVTLLLAPIFGTIAYLAVYGDFDRGGANITLSLIMFLKILSPSF